MVVDLKGTLVIVTLDDINEALAAVSNLKAQEQDQCLVVETGYGNFSARITIELAEADEDDPQALEISFWLLNQEFNPIVFCKDSKNLALAICNSFQCLMRWGKLNLEPDESGDMAIVLWTVIDILPQDIVLAKIGSRGSLLLRTLERLSGEFKEMGQYILAYVDSGFDSKDIQLLSEPHLGEA